MTLRRRTYLVEGKRLIELPYSEYDIESVLQDKGWHRDFKESKRLEKAWSERYVGMVMTKKFGMFRVKLLIRGGIYTKDFEVYIPYGSILKRIDIRSEELMAKAKKVYSKSVGFPNTLDMCVREIEKTANEVVAAVKQLPRAKKEKREFEWREKTGREARKKWEREVEEVIIEILDTDWAKKRGGLDTRDIMLDLLNNRYFLPSYVSRKDAAQMVKVVLKRMERQKKIESYEIDRRKYRWVMKGD